MQALRSSLSIRQIGGDCSKAVLEMNNKIVAKEPNFSRALYSEATQQNDTAN